MPCVNSCCCCSLKTGGLIMGWLGTIDAVIKGIGVIVFIIFLSNDENFPNIYGAARTGMIASSVISVVLALLVSILLLVGSNKSKHLCLLPWLIINGIATFGGLLAILIVGGFCIASGNQTTVMRYSNKDNVWDNHNVEVTTNYATIGLIIYGIGIPLCCLNIYFWICILSLYQSIRKQNRRMNI